MRFLLLADQNGSAVQAKCRSGKAGAAPEDNLAQTAIKSDSQALYCQVRRARLIRPPHLLAPAAPED
ncbi:hypothetical protein AB838_02460 [Rhodobacteraceae bacterium (ex Bugula neritina AB1)]|nr:hypothetical protein AB838_02460 [Rhodobacteraceae bacterium (ex Bugula neritina AB1)]